MPLLAIIRGIIIVISMAVYLLFYAFSRIVLPHTKESAFSLRRHWIKYVCLPILNIKTELVGKPIDSAALYISNHRSFLDPAIISKYLDAFVIAKAEIADYPIINKGAEVTGVIWVRRSNKDSRAATRQAYVDTIKDGYNVLVFPEGTISTDPHTLPFKKGTFHSAAEEGFTVIPIALEYKDETDLWKNPNLLKYYLRQCNKWAIHTKLTFGPSIESKDGFDLHCQAEEWINQELVRMQEGWSKAFVSDE